VSRQGHLDTAAPGKGMSSKPPRVKCLTDAVEALTKAPYNTSPSSSSATAVDADETSAVIMHYPFSLDIDDDMCDGTLQPASTTTTTTMTGHMGNVTTTTSAAGAATTTTTMSMIKTSSVVASPLGQQVQYQPPTRETFPGLAANATIVDVKLSAAQGTDTADPSAAAAEKTVSSDNVGVVEAHDEDTSRRVVIWGASAWILSVFIKQIVHKVK